MQVRVRKRKKRHEGYRMVTFPRRRRLMLTIGQVSHKHTIHGLMELDVTRVRQLMREHKTRTGAGLSFTAFLAACMGQAVEMHPEMQALRWVSLLPAFSRRLFVWFMLKNPRLIKAFMGTVGLTAIGMFAKRGGWGIGLPSLHTLSIVVGGIAERPALVNGKVEAHEYLSVTLDFDHDLIDGASAARFTQHLSELIESGYGLDGFSVELEQAAAP